MIKIVRLLLITFLLLPTFVSAQSLEWLAEHPGSTTVAMMQSTGTPVVAPNTNDGLEARVRAYFSDIPVMASIAQCESRFRQFDDSGNALDGGAGAMIGLFQISASVHAAYAKSLGMDIYTVDGNLAYARMLYNQDGTDPWLDSFSCWHPLSTGTTSDALTQDLVLGMINPEVEALQILLNGHGYVLATAGPGSPGQETTKFGALTRTAVRKFQCDKMRLCTGDEGTNGYGMVGASTREALLSFSETGAVLTSATTPSSGTAVNPDEAVQIAALKKEIADLTAQIFALKQKLGQS